MARTVRKKEVPLSAMDQRYRVDEAVAPQVYATQPRKVKPVLEQG